MAAAAATLGDGAAAASGECAAAASAPRSLFRAALDKEPSVRDADGAIVTEAFLDMCQMVLPLIGEAEGGRAGGRECAMRVAAVCTQHAARASMHADAVCLTTCTPHPAPPPQHWQQQQSRSAPRLRSCATTSAATSSACARARAPTPRASRSCSRSSRTRSRAATTRTGRRAPRGCCGSSGEHGGGGGSAWRRSGVAWRRGRRTFLSGGGVCRRKRSPATLHTTHPPPICTQNPSSFPLNMTLAARWSSWSRSCGA